MEREVETSVVNCQHCYESQGCPLIVNTVVEATLLSRQRSKGFGKGNKIRRHQREHTLSIFQVIFSSQVLALLCKPLLTVHLCMAEGGQMWLHYALITQVTTISGIQCIVGIDSNFGTSSIWSQCGGDYLIQVITKAGSTIKNLSFLMMHNVVSCLHAHN